MRPALVSRHAARFVLPVLCTILTTSSARADDDCPPGSVYRTQEGYSFCEPTVCENDGQCNAATEVCRPIALCMQVGVLDEKRTTKEGDAGQRLVVTQRCAPDKACPQNTVCSDKGRCISKTVAEKMGILVVTPASPSRDAASAGEKRSCGCGAVGADLDRGNASVDLGLAAFGVSIALGRRRRRA